MLQNFYPFIVFILSNAWLVYISKRRFGEVLPLTLMLSTLIVFYSQYFFHSFKWGEWLIVVAAISAVPMAIIGIKNDLDFRKRLFSNGLFSVVVVFAFVMIIDNQRTFTEWDEFSHWGKMVKEMIRLDRFYADAESTLLVHKDYPPFVSLFEMLWCFFRGGYSEANVTKALHFFELSAVVPVISEKLELEKGKMKYLASQLVLFLLSALFIFYFDAGNEFSTIYTDLFVPIIFAYAIGIIIDRDFVTTKTGFLAIISVQINLILSKQIGIALVMLVWLLFTLYLDWKKDNIVRNLGLSGVLLIIPAIHYLGWSRYVKSVGIVGQFDLGKISLSGIVGIILGKGDHYQTITARDYLQSLFTVSLTGGIIKAPYVVAAIIPILILIVAYYYKIISKNTLRHFCLFYIFGCIGYSFTLFVLYMYCFKVGEMLALASFCRYMGTYLLGAYLSLLYLFVESLRNKHDNREIQLSGKAVAIVLLTVLLICDAGKMTQLLPQSYLEEVGIDYKYKAEYIQKHTQPGDRIFLIASDTAKTMYYLNYYLEDRIFDVRYVDSDNAQMPTKKTDFWEQLCADLMDNDYVYVYDSSESINEVLGGYTDESVVHNDSIYLIDKDNHILLKKID